jgi:hypothetical protein
MSPAQMIPSARRLMESLRDIGYDLDAAVADLVDNSIDADAARILIDIGQDLEGGWLRICDDGLGMTEGQLTEAMRYGSARDYDVTDLGHFGLGLKTASLSQGRRLTVASRSSTRGPVRIRRWDLDHVARTDSWDLETLRVRDCPTMLTDPLAHGTGTVVLWEQLDRVLGARTPGGAAAASRLESAIRGVAQHLAMVFHRFLAGEAPGPPLEIKIGGRSLEPWDPFARGEPLTRTLPAQSVPFDHAGVTHSLPVQPYILPGQQHFSSPDAHELASGPRRWNRQQGIYVYRHHRLVQSGGWNRLRTLDEHSKLARVAIDIPPETDAAFRLNVSKMTVGLPDAVRPQLRALVAGVVSAAQDAYRRRLVDVRSAEDEGTASRARSAVTVGDQWPQILGVLEGRLSDHPRLLDELLVDLANLRPLSVEEPAIRSARIRGSSSG